MGRPGDVRATIVLAGFDPGAEPIVREMRDGSLLLIFAFMPPLVSQNDVTRTARFNFETFGTEIEKGVGAPVIWDDREVFVIQHPLPDTIERIRVFLLNYWEG